MNVIGTTPRATRYDLTTPVVYRREGEDAWQEGQAVNVSRTGVLFQPKGPGLPLETAVEFVLELPRQGFHRRARVECRGRIARRCGDQASPTMIAATIDHYRFLHPAAKE